MHEAATKLPPQDLDAERSVLGSILFDGRTLDDVASVITASDFYLDAHTVIYQAIQAVGVGIDSLTVRAELLRRGKLEEIGGDAYLAKVIDSVIHAQHAGHHAKMVREKSLVRKAIYAAGDVMHRGYDSNVRSADLLNDWAKAVHELLEIQTHQAEGISGIALRAMDRLTSPRQEGLKLGFQDIDELLYGAKPGEVLVIGARPGIGKSAWAGNVARRVAERTGVLFCSIEMTRDELHDRLVVSDLGISLSELRPMARAEYTMPHVNEAINGVGSLNLIIDDSPEQTIASIRSQARLAKRKMELGLIIVDYLQLITATNKRDSREQQVAANSWGLKAIAKEFQVPVIALAQLNREIEKRHDKTPQLSDLRESGAIEQNANVVILLDRPNTWDADKYATDEAIAYVKKHRGGATGKVDLKWNARSATFRDASIESDLRLPDDEFN